MRTIIVCLATIMLLTMASAVVSAAERTPPGSYLVYRATSVSELRKQLSTNKVVQARYSKHFGVSPQKLDKFIADNLHLIALKQPMKVETWYIDRRGNTTVKKKLLPAGTMVFATKSGEPVLTWSCGNPVRTDLPKAKLDVKVEPVVEVISTAVVTAPPTPAVVSMLPVEAVPTLAFTAAPAVSMPPLMGSITNLAGWLGALGGVVLLKKSPGYNVPEASTALAMASFLCLLPAMYRTRRRQ